MKAVKTKEVKKRNWAIPGQTVTHEEFMAAIRKAEKGPFMTNQEFKDRFYKWRKDKYQL
jgi:hypothetical protein